MKDVSKIRNFAVAGHAGSGKTMLCELMLNKAGAIPRPGSIAQKNTVSDYFAEEQERQGSIYATPMHCRWRENYFFFIDTPGYGEFVGETIAALQATDIVLIVIDGVNGIEVGTNRAWQLAKKRSLPRCIFINGLDRDRSDYFAVLNQIQEIWGKTVCIPITMPVGKEGSFAKVVHVLRDKKFPAELQQDVDKYRERLMDAIAESDEVLMERYLSGEELTDAEISSGLHKAIAHGDLVPVFCGSVAKDVGVEQMMNGVVNLFPCPADIGKFKQQDGTEVVISADGEAEALVFKSLQDPFIGQLNYFRVLNGVFKPDTEVWNISTNTKERFGAIILMNGKTQMPVDEAGPGFIAAVAKLKNTHTNNTLAYTPNVHEAGKIVFPEPVMSYAISAVKSGEEEKIAAGLHRLTESDPTISFRRHEETHELLLSGMGDQHLNNVIKKLRDTYKVEVNVATPKIPYRETITGSGNGHYRHKKQTGGHGQFAEVDLKLEYNPDGYEFVNAVVGGTIPRNFIPAVEKGVMEALERGPLAGCKVENIKVSVLEGKYHPVDSSEMAFKIASRGAFHEAMHKAHPVLLEPIMTVKIMVPEEFMGDITGDLNHKRGRILGMDVEDALQVVRAEVPLAELAKYATEMRSMTQGRGFFEMEFSRYEQVPPVVANAVIAQFQAENKPEE